MKKSKLFLATIILGLSTSASAELVKVDYLAAGDKLNFVDTETNLEWLNFNATRGMSYDEAIANVGDGWLLADFDSVLDTLNQITDISYMVLMGMDNVEQWHEYGYDWDDRLARFDYFFGENSDGTNNFGMASAYNGKMTLSGTFIGMYRGFEEQLFKTANFMFGGETIPDEHSYSTYMYRDYVPKSFDTGSVDEPLYNDGETLEIGFGGSTSEGSNSGSLFTGDEVFAENQGDLSDVPTPIALGTLGLGLLGFSTRRKKNSN